VSVESKSRGEIMSKSGIEKFARISKNYMENPDIRKEMVKNEVTKKILDAMEEKNISKADLARKLKTTPSNVSQILNGNRNLTIDTICEISMALGMISQISFVDKDSLSTNCFTFDDSEIYTGSLEACSGSLPGGYWSSLQDIIAYT
jgi:transcriptional regulator with XRE-family HTH domain